MSGPIQAAGAPTGPIPADIPIPAPLTEVTVTALPERLQQLARTVQIAGQVIAQEDGTATVRTAVGDVVVRTPVPLPTDRPVVLQIAPPAQPNAPPPPALVLLLGSPTAPAAAPTGAPAVATPTAATASVPAGAAPVLPDLLPGAVIKAVVIQAAAPRFDTASPTAPVSTPAGVPTPIVTTTVPAPGGPPPSTNTPPATAPTPLPATPAAIPPLPAAPPAAARAAPAPTAPSTQAGPAAAPASATAPAATPAAAAPPPVWAGLPPLARSIPLTAPTPADNALTPQLAAAAALTTPVADAGKPPLSAAVAARILPAATGAPAPPAGSPQPAAPVGSPAAATAPQIAMIALGALPEEAIATPVTAPTSATAPATPQPTGAPTTPGQATSVQTSALQTTATPAPSATPAAAAPVLAPLRQGATVQLTVLAIGPEALTPTADTAVAAPPAMTDAKPAAPPVPAGTPLSGRLEGTTSRGQPVVTTPAGTLLLAARTELPAGTPIRLEALLPDIVAETGTTADMPPIDPLQGRTWPALKEVLATLAAVDPRLAHSVAQQVLPQPTPKLTTSLLAFLGALRGGNAAGWLGDAATGALERAGRGDLLARLSDDFRSLGLQGQERLVGDWRALTVPFGQMGDVRAFQFAVRQPDPEEAGAAAASRAARRFLIDIELTKLGALQLDGLTSAGRFDLVVRSLQLLPGELKRDLLTIFSGSLQAVGFTGQLAFQTGSQQWVKLTPLKRRGRETST